MLMSERRLAGGNFLIWVYHPWSSSRKTCMAVMRAVTVGWEGRSAWASMAQRRSMVRVGMISRSTRCSTTVRKSVQTSAEVSEEVATVADAAVDLHQVPVLQFLEAGADVGAGNGEGVGDILGGEGFRREVEQRVHLGDGAVDPPAGAHFAPVQDELLHGVGELHVFIISVISV